MDPLLIFSRFDQIYLLLCKEITMFYFFTKSGFTLIEFTYTQSRKRLFTFVIFNELLLLTHEMNYASVVSF